MNPRFSKEYSHFPSKQKGSLHWALQRLTGMLLVFLSGWFLFFLADFPLSHKDSVIYLTESWNALCLVTFILLAFWHGYLGMEVILDDYIPNALRYSIAFFCLRLSVVLALVILGWSFFELFF